VNVHGVKPVRSSTVVRRNVHGSNLAELNRSVYSFCCVPPCVADVGVDCAGKHPPRYRRNRLCPATIHKNGCVDYTSYEARSNYLDLQKFTALNYAVF